MSKQKVTLRNDGRPDFVEEFIKAAVRLSERKEQMSEDPDVTCQVEFRINGVDCPFVEVLHELEKEASEHVEQRAAELCEERMDGTNAKFDDLLEGIEKAFDRFKQQLKG